MVATKDKLFNPAKLSAQQKAAQTEDTARRIIEAEAIARDKKTDRLRKLRLEQEALQPAAEPAPKKKKQKA